jgi:SagB-type dehydrogenase family enzyme
MSLKTLGDILGRAICNAEDPEGPKHRPYPSAGALYPVEVYVLAMRFQDLPSGLYHYDPHRHGLSALLEKDVSDDFRMMICDDAIADPNLVFIITAAFFRSCLKYEGRGYRYALIEAGAVAQTINLCCRSVGLDGIWLGGFADELVQDFLDINWEMEIEAPVLMLGVGKKREIGPL